MVKFLHGLYHLRGGKPRVGGLTMVLDRLARLVKTDFDPVAEYVDIVKIGWGLPSLVESSKIKERIYYYHDRGVRVSTGGTQLEISASRGMTERFFDEARDAGFDIAEISEGVIDLTLEQKLKLAENAVAHGLDFYVEVGRKDPRNQLTLEQTLAKIEEAKAAGSKKIILESRESGLGVGIYDEKGDIKADWVNTIANTFGHETFIFEAPLEHQQTALILLFGPAVNLGNVSMDNVAPLESQRLGLRGDTFGLSKPLRLPTASPSAKFIYHLISTYQPIDQSTLVSMTNLPRRTVQAALAYLKEHNHIKEQIDVADSRRRKYILT